MDLWEMLKITTPWAPYAIIGLSCFFEFTKIPINPLSSLFNWFSNKITSKTDSKIDDLSDTINKKFDDIVYVKSAHYKEITDGIKEMKVKIEELSDIGDEREMKRLRTRLLAFASELRKNDKKSRKEYFDIIEVHNDYEMLIKKHNFANGVIDEEFSYIMEKYREVRDDDGALK